MSLLYLYPSSGSHHIQGKKQNASLSNQPQPFSQPQILLSHTGLQLKQEVGYKLFY